jgi:hypothetical protein
VNDPRDDDQKTGARRFAENKKPAITFPGVVEKIVKPIAPNEPEKAQIKKRR